MPWGPTKIVRVDRVYGTSARTALVETDAGPAYVKALGSPEGPHILACEIVGTRAARWLGLPTFEYATIVLNEGSLSAYPEGQVPDRGPAYATKAEDGTTWGENDGALNAVENVNAMTGLVILDTWILNCDRYWPRADGTRNNQRNVFFSWDHASKGKSRLVAMDHTHAFTCGASLTPEKLRSIDRRHSTDLYGLFPGFIPFVTREHAVPFVDRLRTFNRDDAEELTMGIPPQWGLTRECAKLLGDFLLDRASFLAGRLLPMLETSCSWDPVLDISRDPEDA